MAEYLSYEEYESYGLHSIDEGEFKALSIYASRLIDAYTFFAIRKYGLMDSPAYAGDIKDAMAFQIDFMSLIGLEKAIGADEGAGAPVSSESETIGNYSHSRSYGSGDSQDGSRQVFVGTMQVSPLAVSALAPIQALGRRIGC